MHNLILFFKKDKRRIIVAFIFLIFVFLRLYNVEAISIFRYDQVDSAWAAKRIIVDHNFPLVGGADKLGSGIFVGPGYYYLISIFYFFTNLDPIAAPLFAATVAALNFFSIFYVSKKIFNFKTAIIAILIYTVAFHAIFLDRIQWEINFVPSVSILVFYSLYRILKGNEKFVFFLAFILGFAFHVHLTVAVYMPIAALLTFPFFPKTKKMLKYLLFSLPLFLVWLSPIIIATLNSKSSLFNGSVSYAGLTYHGIHLRRILQMTSDAFIEIQSFLYFKFLSFAAFFIAPLFMVVYYLQDKAENKFALLYLVSLWFIIPWFVLSTYRGEITPYYYSTTLPVVLMILAYLLVGIAEYKKTVATAVVVCLGLYTLINLNDFFKIRTVGIRNFRWAAQDALAKGRIVEYKEGDPTSFMYYYYKRRLQLSSVKNKSV